VHETAFKEFFQRPETIKPGHVRLHASAFM